VPGTPRELNVTQRLPTMLIMNAVKPAEDGGMPVIGYRVQYDKDNKTLYDFDTSKGWYWRKSALYKKVKMVSIDGSLCEAHRRATVRHPSYTAQLNARTLTSARQLSTRFTCSRRMEG